MPKPVKIKTPAPQPGEAAFARDLKEILRNLSDGIYNVALEADGVTCTEQGGKLSVVDQDLSQMFKVVLEDNKISVINGYEEIDVDTGYTVNAGYFQWSEPGEEESSETPDRIVPIVGPVWDTLETTEQTQYLYIVFDMVDGKVTTNASDDTIPSYEWLVSGTAFGKYNDDNSKCYILLAVVDGVEDDSSSEVYDYFEVRQVWTRGVICETDINRIPEEEYFVRVVDNTYWECDAVQWLGSFGSATATAVDTQTIGAGTIALKLVIDSGDPTATIEKVTWASTTWYTAPTSLADAIWRIPLANITLSGGIYSVTPIAYSNIVFGGLPAWH